jgi:alkylated DNA repair protein (DNA oxidative demethylase)
MRKRVEVMDDLLSGVRSAGTQLETLAPGAMLFRGFADADAPAIAEALQQIIATAPLRHMVTPGGHRMSVAMTNCGRVGWVTDGKGYRYDAIDPLSGKRWPSMPPVFLQLAERAAAAAGFSAFEPDSCLINRYEPGARLSLHQDRNEHGFDAPIVSVSLGLPAIFLFGGLVRNERPRRLRLENGDVVVWGGPARLAFHGVEPLADGNHPLTGRCRLNLTFRRAL